ncbi:hypothetical protein F4806DRAFT_496210 [Annulohypoxylon nitens]|nr:hypothetical protein F4806DRAFT_496210 [Annulohypoxylon nitens]
MKCWPRLLFLFSAGLVAAGIATSVESSSELSISDVRRTKVDSNATCVWHFTVINSTSDAGTNDIFSCNFDVRAVPGTDCGVASFESSCKSNSSYTINGGHSDQGFVVIVLVNSAQGSMAYFAFTDDELDSGSKISNQTQPVYPHALAQTGDLLVGRQDDGNNTPSSTEWKVEDMFRDVDVQKHTVTIGFRLLDGSAGGSRCKLILTPPEGADMQSWQWYNRECDGSGYFASWGYMKTGDAGVMTIVNSTRNGLAFFGFSNINSSSYLGDAGPSPVSPCKCG